ncbi:inositol polyphosphate 5-phosphatase ocrl-1 [Fusarium subglutinans]|uniref:Inositol polyphosphate 5-phosphatase ocrl-1 n=1 Tax=Gibberella subglutinans TaxID=42677 RepID=A0A8H5P467_GIBSU|nr:inositol polyphosphate 5-phosphatase ocrl-1 [Fusarium subglutinans]KAF5590286.1 inositol polyphosphate 5-phosphatase ocrl-1 [Fusarium subglutinans]
MADENEQSPGSELGDPTSTTPQSLAKAVHARRSEFVRPHSLKVKIGTWNVAACTGTDKDLATWFTHGEGLDQQLTSLNLSQNSAVETDDKDNGSSKPHLTAGGDIGLYVLGLQEIVDLNTTKEYMNRAVYTDTSVMDKWKAALEAALPQGYELVTAEQMTGLLLLVYASPEIAPTISNVSTKQVGTGLLGYFGNKGAVTTRLLLGETTRMVFINSHLASGAGSSYLDRRCWDVGQVLSRTQFEPIVHSGVEEDEGEKIGDEDLAFWFGDLNFRLDGIPGDDIRRLLTLHARGEYGADEDSKPLDERGVIIMKGSDSDDESSTRVSLHSREESFDTASDLPDPDDFPEDPSQDPTSLQATIDSLLPHDQLRRVIKQRKAFHDGWQEGEITFLPTYKYDIGTVGLFDSSEKQRAPSWCDRILFRTRKDKQDYETKIKDEEEAKKKDAEMKSRGLEEDEDVLFSYDPDADGEDPTSSTDTLGYDEYEDNDDPEAEELVTKEGFHDRIHLEIYTSHQRITSSDHKPITSIFTLDYDAVVPELKAKIHAEVARELDRAENEGRPGITVVVEGSDGNEENIVDFGEVTPLEKQIRHLTVANTGSVPATFSFVTKPTTEDGDDAIPVWLKTTFLSADEESQEPLGETVTLEPGETALVLLELQVSAISHIRALNEARAKIEEVLVLRIEDGRDHFIPVRGIWQPSCVGRSIAELIRIPDGGIRKFVEKTGIKGAIAYDSDIHCSAPKELFKLTEVVQTLVERSLAESTMLEEEVLPRDPGWPLESSTWRVGEADMQDAKVKLVSALDNDASLLDALPLEWPASFKLEAVSSILLLFLESLTDGLIPTQLWAKISTSLPNVTSLPMTAWPDTKTQVLDILSSAPNHNIAFVFLTATLSRAASELTPVTNEPKGGLSRRLSFRRGNAEDEDTKKRKMRERRYAEIVGPLVCRVDEKEKGSRDRARTVVEMFIRRDEGS